MTIRIIVADDHQLFAAGVRTLLEQQSDLEVVKEVDDGRAAVEAARDLTPDVLVMDLTMPGMNGIEATRRITSENPDVKVLVLSMHHEEQLVLATLDAGASGYLLKESALAELQSAIRDVGRGLTYLSPAVAATVVHAYRSGRAAKSSGPFDTLTAREREVLQLIAEGHATKDIASSLSVSAKTVSTHREHIMKKLNMHSVADLTKYAIRMGLTSAEM